MSDDDLETKIEPGMKVAVRRGVMEHIGVVLRVEGKHVIVRWTQSEWPGELEFSAHQDDVKPLKGWGLGDAYDQIPQSQKRLSAPASQRHLPFAISRWCGDDLSAPGVV